MNDKSNQLENVHYQHADFDADATAEEMLAPTAHAEHSKSEPIAHQGLKIGRNDPCPCGSGKKYKQCHGKLA